MIVEKERMRVFILCTGRCGSTTFIKACSHITNYTSAHESRIADLGQRRLDYPDHHIEADNRLAWFLGRLDEAYGDNACFVHLTRARDKVVASYARRADFGLMHAYKNGILGYPEQTNYDPMHIAFDVCETIDANIRFFLRGKSRTMSFALENAAMDFSHFWSWIGAEGDYQAAAAAWQVKTNTSEELEQKRQTRSTPLYRRLPKKLGRILTHIPMYVRNV